MANIVQSGFAHYITGDGLSPSVTLGAAPTAGNMLFAMYIGGGDWGGGATISVSGMTQLFESDGTDPPFQARVAWYKTATGTGETTCTLTLPQDDGGCFWYFELEDVGTPVAGNTYTRDNAGGYTDVTCWSPYLAAPQLELAFVHGWGANSASGGIVHSSSPQWTELTDGKRQQPSGTWSNQSAAWRTFGSGRTFNTFTFDSGDIGYGCKSMIIAFPDSTPAFGTVKQAVTYIDATTTTANVPPSHPTWQTPTAGNRLIVAVAGSTAYSSGPSGNDWVNLLSYSSTYMMEVWTKISDGTENPVNITMAAADGTQIYAMEIVGAPTIDQLKHGTTASGTSVSATSDSAVGVDDLVVAITHAWPTPPSVTMANTTGFDIGIDYDDGANSEAYNQAIHYTYATSASTITATTDWTGGNTDFGQVFLISMRATPGVAYRSTAYAQITADGTFNIPIPTGAANGDVLVLKFSGDGHSITSEPSDGTNTAQLVGTQLDTTVVRQRVYTIPYLGNNISYTIDVVGTPNANIEVSAWMGVNTSNPVDSYQQATSGGTATTSHVFPALTPTQDLTGVAALMSGTALGGNTGTITSPFTERNDNEYWGLSYLGTYDQAAAAQLQPTVTTTVSENGCYTMLALRPASGTAANPSTTGELNTGGGLTATWNKLLNQILRPASTVAAGSWDTGPTTGQSLHGYTSDDSDTTYIEDAVV